MNINDLMIGDWVMFNPFNHENIAKHPARISSINERYFTFVQSISLDDRPGLVRPFKRDGQPGIEPIPLAGEILEKNGWTHFGENNGYMAWNSIEHWCYGNRKHNAVIAWKSRDDGKWFIKYHSEDGFTNISIPLKTGSVHELQHALKLVGVEMEITL